MKIRECYDPEELELLLGVTTPSLLLRLNSCFRVCSCVLGLFRVDVDVFF